MKTVFKHYFGHPSIWLYFATITALATYLQMHGEFLKNWYLAGVLLIAPFYEWLVHKYILHANPPVDWKWFNGFMERLHRGHHKDPYNIPLIFAQWYIGFSFPFQFYLLGRLCTLDHFSAVFLGLVAMIYYTFYEWMHLAHHIDEYTPKTKRGALLKKAHKWHHFKNEHWWWGITSIFGDQVLGTLPDPKEVPRSVTVKDIVLES